MALEKGGIGVRNLVGNAYSVQNLWQSSVSDKIQQNLIKIMKISL